MSDMLNPPVEKDNLRWKVHHSLTHPDSKFDDVISWCWDTFGHPGTDPDTGTYSNWDYYAGWVYFYEEKYVTMYILRWK